MGHVGFKEFAYDFLSKRYPKAYVPEDVAEEAMRNGINSRSGDPTHSLGGTLRRLARPGDRHRDARFSQRYEEGRIVIFAYPPGYGGGDAPGTTSAGSHGDSGMPTDTTWPEPADELNSDAIADLLVDHGEFPHRVDALKAIAELPLRGVLLPQRLLRDLESAIEQERQARGTVRKLISEVRGILDGKNP